MGNHSKKNTSDVASFWLRGDPGTKLVYDAIVVGSGAAGGVAAERLCAQGLNTLVLEAGQLPGEAHRPFTGALSTALNMVLAVGVERQLSPTFLRLGEKAVRLAGRVRQPVQSKCFAWALDPEALVDDIDCPYITDPDAPFHWFRSRQPGGRMIVPGHGRQYYRIGGKHGRPEKSAEPGWPFDLDELAPWYSMIERRLKLRGGAVQARGLAVSDLSEVLALAGPEIEIVRALKVRWPGSQPILGQHAPPVPWLDKAAETGRLTCRAGAVVRKVLIGETGVAEGAEWYDCETGLVMRASAPIVFLCASTIETTRILMVSGQRPGAEAAGIHSHALGRYLMDHASIGATGFSSSIQTFGEQSTEPGHCIYVPPISAELGAFGMQVHIHPLTRSRARVDVASFAEILPEATNAVTLDPSRLDKFGMPVSKISFRYSAAQRELGRKQIETVRHVCDDLGLEHINFNNELATPGSGIHECGTARMGSDPVSSVVDRNNQCWNVKGLYVTDGACFPRIEVENPTLTIMALTARAAHHAVQATQTAGVLFRA